MDQPLEDMDQPLEDEFNHTNEEVPRGSSYRPPPTLENTKNNLSKYGIDVDLPPDLRKKVRRKQIQEWKNPTEKHELSSCIRKRLIPPCWTTHINTPQKCNECIEDGKNSTNCRYSEHLEAYVPHCVKADTSKCRKATKEYDDWKEKYNSKKAKTTTAAHRGAQVKFADENNDDGAGLWFSDKYGSDYHILDRNKIPPISALHTRFEFADMDDKLRMLYHLNNDKMFGNNRWRKARDENGKRVYVAAQTDWETDEGWATYWYGPAVNNFKLAKDKEWCPKESYDEKEEMCNPEEEEEIAEQFEKNVNISGNEPSSLSSPPLGGGRRRRKTRAVKRNKKKRTRRRNKNIKRLTKKRRSKKRKGTRKI